MDRIRALIIAGNTLSDQAAVEEALGNIDRGDELRAGHETLLKWLNELTTEYHKERRLLVEQMEDDLRQIEIEP